MRNCLISAVGLRFADILYVTAMIYRKRKNDSDQSKSFKLN